MVGAVKLMRTRPRVARMRYGSIRWPTLIATQVPQRVLKTRSRRALNGICWVAGSNGRTAIEPTAISTLQPRASAQLCIAAQEKPERRALWRRTAEKRARDYPFDCCALPSRGRTQASAPRAASVTDLLRIAAAPTAT